MSIDATDLRTAGTYALLFQSSAASIEVGALREVVLPAGFVVYVGSAFGPGGLAGRLRHHLRPMTRPRWHLDYLRPALELRGAWIGAGPRHIEHSWAKIFSSLPNVTLPRRRLGASDCRCDAHLFHFRRRPGREEVARLLSEASAARAVRFLAASRLSSSAGASR